MTVEHALYGLSICLALALRLVALERWPLLEREAASALAAWRFARGLPAALRGHSPVLFHLNSLLFYFTNGGDHLARLGSLAFGTLLVCLPYGLRGQLGRVGALAASLLLGMSPTFVYFSRAVDGHIVVAFCALALLTAGAGYLKDRSGTPVIAGVCMALLALLAAPSGYTVLVVLLTLPLFLWAWARFRYRGWWVELLQAWRDLRKNAGAVRGILPMASVLFLALGLGFTANPAGLQMALDQLGQWTGGLLPVSLSVWYKAPLLLILYEALPLILGLAGFLLERPRDDLWWVGLRYWFVATLVLSTVPGRRQASSVLLMVLPLVLSAGWAVGRLWQELREVLDAPLLWALVAASLLVLGAAYLQLVNYLSFATPNYLLRIAALAVFLVSCYALVWSLSGRDVPLRAAALSLALVLSLGMIRMETRLNYFRARDPLEPMVGDTTSPDLLRFAERAPQLSSHIVGDPHAMEWVVADQLQNPLGWYLRSFEQVSYATGGIAGPEAHGVITLGEGSGPSGFVGLRYGLRSRGATLQRTPEEWLRWWVGSKSPAPSPAEEELVLWVRASEQ